MHKRPVCSPVTLRRKAAMTSTDRLRWSRVESDGATRELAGSDDHACARRSPYSISSRRFGGRGERGLICPGAQKARTACGRGPTRRPAARHGSSCAASGNGAARRPGIPSGSAATTSGHGAASDAANRCTAAPGRAENSRAVRPERTALSGRTATATGADRPARAAHPAAAANHAGAPARHAFAPECAAPGAH